MEKTKNLQDTFLCRARAERVPLTLFLMNGFQLRGVLRAFDSFTVVLDSDGRQQLIYKHAISTIAPARARLIGGAGERAELEIVIHQGLNRQIRRMCAMAGLRVLRLIRVGEGPLSLGDLPPGRWRLLTPAERRALLAAGVEKEKRP